MQHVPLLLPNTATLLSSGHAQTVPILHQISSSPGTTEQNESRAASSPQHLRTSETIRGTERIHRESLRPSPATAAQTAGSSSSTKEEQPQHLGRHGRNLASFLSPKSRRGKDGRKSSHRRKEGRGGKERAQQSRAGSFFPDERASGVLSSL